MQSEHYEIETEEPGQLVGRIRDHLRMAEEAAQSDPAKAKRSENIASELIERLSKQVLNRAMVIAKSQLGTANDLHWEGVAETYKELNRVIRSVDTREGLEKCFLATFQRIALDACRRVRVENKPVSGHGASKVSVESGDIREDDEAGGSGETILESAECAELSQRKEWLQRYMTFIDKVAIETILPRIPERQQMVLALKIQGHTFEEIAQKLNINRDTASSDYAKVKAFIKNNL